MPTPTPSRRSELQEDTYFRVLRMLHPGQRSIEIVDALNTSLRTIERWLKQLKDEGKIEFKGAPKTGGYHSTQHNATNPKESNKK